MIVIESLASKIKQWPLCILSSKSNIIRKESGIINDDYPNILKVADRLKVQDKTDVLLTKAAFEWLRDEIDYSLDIDAKKITAVA